MNTPQKRNGAGQKTRRGNCRAGARMSPKRNWNPEHWNPNETGIRKHWSPEHNWNPPKLEPGTILESAKLEPGTILESAKLEPGTKS
ncbi:hypothetical protein TNCT_524081 [Trichonephila clavata]|uniref:Uncharacterized protein n=1 Tax=Trichonephila clavata TaxID=2740835 RepID=A0A8X6KJD9_TRICU|nr:hypothetical protein TNCT_524081 [Trichonephila clavata]